MKKIDWAKVWREIGEIKFSKNENRDRLVKLIWFVSGLIYIYIYIYIYSNHAFTY
jgi:hypothetical protein